MTHFNGTAPSHPDHITLLEMLIALAFTPGLEVLQALHRCSAERTPTVGMLAGWGYAGQGAPLYINDFRPTNLDAELASHTADTSAGRRRPKRDYFLSWRLTVHNETQTVGQVTQRMAHSSRRTLPLLRL